MARHEVQKMRFPPEPRASRVALRLCMLTMVIAGLAATSKVFVDVLRHPRDVQHAREALQRHDTLATEQVDAIVVLRRDAAETIKCLQDAAAGSGPEAEHARNALHWLQESLR